MNWSRDELSEPVPLSSATSEDKQVLAQSRRPLNHGCVRNSLARKHLGAFDYSHCKSVVPTAIVNGTGDRPAVASGPALRKPSRHGGARRLARSPKRRPKIKTAHATNASRNRDERTEGGEGGRNRAKGKRSQAPLPHSNIARLPDHHLQPDDRDGTGLSRGVRNRACAPVSRRHTMKIASMLHAQACRGYFSPHPPVKQLEIK